MATEPQEKPIPEELVAEQRSLTGDIIIGTGALVGPSAAVYLKHHLESGNEEPPPPPQEPQELPPDVSPED